MSAVRVGVSMADLPDVTECARHLTTWTPPVHVWCKQIGVFAEVFSIIAEYSRYSQ